MANCSRVTRNGVRATVLFRLINYEPSSVLIFTSIYSYFLLHLYVTLPYDKEK